MLSLVGCEGSGSVGAVRVRIHPGGSKAVYGDRKVTLSGVGCRELRQILVGAALHFYDDLDKHKETGPSPDPEAHAYASQMLKLVQRSEDAISKAIHDSWPHNAPRPKTKAERLEAARESKRTREMFDRLLDGLRTRKGESK